jgi:hypothetical protein
LPGATVGKAYSQAVSASDGATPYSYAVTAGALPGGLTLDAASGILACTPTTSAHSPVTTRVSPSADGLTLGFATSLAQMEAARDNAYGATDAASSPINVWVDGALLAHNNEENGGKWGIFAMVSTGADYLLSEKAFARPVLPLRPDDRPNGETRS